jgi:hypothetical protein
MATSVWSMPSSGAGGGTGSLVMHHLNLRLHGSIDGTEHGCDKVPIPVGVVASFLELLSSQAGSTRLTSSRLEAGRHGYAN